jgi:DegV family protein with EDD domain
MSYLIFTDVSVDIDREFAKKNDVRFVPMEYVLGDENFNCTEPESDEMMHNYYDKLRQKVVTHTSQIVPYNYTSVFEPLIKEGNSIIYISLSSGLSNTYESALLAAKELQEDYPEAELEIVDSYGATGGMGILTELAVSNRDKGMTIKENAAWLREHSGNVNYWFKVEDLMYLKRGGRVSATTADVGTAFNIKPILTINAEGKLDTIDKKRGTKMAMKALIEKFENNYDASISNLVYISCADCKDEAEKLKEELLKKHPDINIKMTMLSPIIGAHTGPDMLALIYMGKSR